MILCCGEALIDMLPGETASGAEAFRPCPGGGLFNTAVALGRLGLRTGFLSGISTDPFGARLIAALTAAGVTCDLAIRSDRPTTLAFALIRDGQARYVFYDEGSAGRMLAPVDLPAIPDRVQAMVFGGISLMAEPCGTAYETLMRREAATRVTMIDPNIRPAMIRNEPAYRARLARMLAVADIVKLSDEDLRWLEGPGEIADLARQVLARGPRLVFITEGAHGAHGFSARETEFVPALSVPVVDTIGAGDTFNAGALAALERAGALSKTAIAAASPALIRAALAAGNRAAAVTVGREGADPPWATELEQ
ncbi:MAG: carbohydrate kinase [Sphingomonadales bacterium]|nr:carbohydrate kinase [Sphingomonadales bacterium]